MTVDEERAERTRTIGVLKTMLAALETALADEPAAGGAHDQKIVTGLAAIPGYTRLPLQ